MVNLIHKETEGNENSWMGEAGGDRRSARLCFASPLTLKYSGEGDRGGTRPPSKQVEDLQSEAEGV